MRFFIALAIILLAPPAVVWPALAQQQMDPLSPAREGKLECGSVDHATKTCAELARYTLRPDGTYDLSTEMLIQSDPLLVMTWEGRVYVRDSMICSKLERADFDTTRFYLDGRLLGSDEAHRVRNFVRPAYDEVLGRESCLKIIRKDGKFFEEYFLDGTPKESEAPIEMQWVSPEDGFKLK